MSDEYAAVPLPPELADVLHAGSDVRAALDQLAAARAWRDVVISRAIADGHDASAVYELGGPW